MYKLMLLNYLFVFFLSVQANPQIINYEMSLVNHIGPHPRMFVNATDIDRIKNKYNTPSSEKNKIAVCLADTIKKHYVTDVTNSGTIANIKKLHDNSTPWIFPTGITVPDNDYGHDAFTAAILFKIGAKTSGTSSTPITLDMAKTFLFASLVRFTRAHSQTAYGSNKGIANETQILWLGFSHQSAFAAYDLLYNELTSDERKYVEKIILDHVELIQYKEQKFDSELTPTLKVSNDWITASWANKSMINQMDASNSGFYGVNSLMWFAGLATYHIGGTNDKRVLQFINKGYRDHIKMINSREKLYNGSTPVPLNYSIQGYLAQEFAFLRTLNSTFGSSNRNLVNCDRHNFDLIKYANEYLFMGQDSASNTTLLHPGDGDQDHVHNNSFNPIALYAPAVQLYDFSVNVPNVNNADLVNLANIAVCTKPLIPNSSTATGEALSNRLKFSSQGAYIPLLLKNDELSILNNGSSSAAMYPLAKYYQSPGKLIVHSSSTPNIDATYALFNVGFDKWNPLKSHKHYDEGSFVIYKNGFQAIDAGSRRNAENNSDHLAHYYSQTVAHNSILISGRNFYLPLHWGAATTESGDFGGMISKGSTLEGRNTSSSNFAYGCANLTNSYFPKDVFEAASLHYTPTGSFNECVKRKFLYFPPDYFVIYDTLSKTTDSQTSAWTMHFENEPDDSKYSATNIFSVVQGSGTLFCKTILPVSSSGTGPVCIVKGGAGTEYVDNTGANFPLPDALGHPMPSGNFRVEISQPSSKKNEEYCHFIQVGNSTTLTSMDPSGWNASVRQFWFTPTVGVYAGKKVVVDFRGAGTVQIVDGNNLIKQGEFTTFQYP